MTIEGNHLCTRCVIPDTFPGVTFDADGVCVFCQEAPSREEYLSNQRDLRAQMETEIARLRGRGEYDAIVAFSGGKDSSFTLQTLVEDYGLNVLAVTIDNGFIASQALVNA